MPTVESDIHLVARGTETQTAWSGRCDRDTRRLSPDAVDAFRKDLDVVVGSAADVESIAVRAERDTDETVSDRDRLRQRRRGQVDDVERARRKVAGGGDRRLRSVRADRDAERPIVDLDLRSRRSDRLTIRQQDAAVGLSSDERHRDARRKDRHEQRADQN